MLDVLLVCTLSTLKVFGVLLAAYVFYWRVYDYILGWRFYSRQGQDVALITPGFLPLLGNLVQVVQSMIKSKREGDNYFVMKNVFDRCLPVESKATSIFFITNGAGLGISDPAVVADLYTTKNKYFDKHPLIKDLSHCLTGDSILFAETSTDWRDTRKALSPAFYKGKLEGLTEIAKGAIKATIARFEKLLEQTKDGTTAEVDIMEEINAMTARILLICAFGVDFSDEPIDYWFNGRLEKRSVGFSLTHTFGDLLARLGSPHV